MFFHKKYNKKCKQFIKYKVENYTRGNVTSSFFKTHCKYKQPHWIFSHPKTTISMPKNILKAHTD